MDDTKETKATDTNAPPPVLPAPDEVLTVLSLTAVFFSGGGFSGSGVAVARLILDIFSKDSTATKTT